MPNVRIIAKGQRGDSLTKLKVNFAPSQSSAPSLYAETNSVYLTRPTEGTGELMELVGGSVAWNQLCNSSSVTGTSGHKFYLKKSGAESITNTNTFTGLASGTDMVTDLTQMLGTAIANYVYSLEQATAGSGIAWLKKYDLIDDQYHAYSAPTLQSVEASAHVTVGKNILDKSGMQYTSSNAYIGATVVNGPADGSFVLNAGSYVFSVSGVDAVQGLYVTNSSGTNIAARYNNTSVAFTLTETTAVKLMIYKNEVTAEILEGYNYQLERGTTATAYEPYTETTYPLDSDLVLRGIPKLTNGVLSYDGDTYEWDGTVTRYYGTRAYQAGDESLTDAITDGTNTVYKLTTPTTESADPYTAVQTVEDGGTEEFVTTNGVPVGVVGRFANAVPMEGVDSFTVTANDGTSHTYPVTLSEEIYRGYVDMLTGEAVSDMASIAEYNGETISEPWLSSLDVYAPGATPTRGAQVVYPITPEEVTATITGDPTELGKVTSASSTEGTVEWSAMAPLDGKCIVRVVL